MVRTKEKKVQKVLILSGVKSVFFFSSFRMMNARDAHVKGLLNVRAGILGFKSADSDIHWIQWLKWERKGTNNLRLCNPHRLRAPNCYWQWRSSSMPSTTLSEVPCRSCTQVSWMSSTLAMSSSDSSSRSLSLPPAFPRCSWVPFADGSQVELLWDWETYSTQYSTWRPQP